MSEENKKLLALMRFWIFGTVLIIIVAVTVYAAIWGVGLLIFQELGYWTIVLVAVVLGIVWYYIYKWYLTRKK
jgi:hypothetical protein